MCIAACLGHVGSAQVNVDASLHSQMLAAEEGLQDKEELGVLKSMREAMEQEGVRPEGRLEVVFQ